MKRDNAKILILAALSAIASLYAIFLFLTTKSPAVLGSYGIYNAPEESRDTSCRSLIAVSMYLGILGWVLTVYEIMSAKKFQFNGSLRKIIDREGFDRDIYRIFSSRGGSKRFAIMQTLATPKLRNEIARITNIDWKEVDRNIRILEESNLVKMQYSHGSLNVYRLTETVEDLIKVIISYESRTSKNRDSAKN